MTPETSFRTDTRAGHRLAITAALLLSSAVAVTWAWNTSLQQVSGADELGFVGGLAISIAVLLLGALFGAARGLTCALNASGRDGQH